MKCNIWKVMLVFSVLLVFAFSGELAAQTADNLYWDVETATLDLEDDQVFTARLTLSGEGVADEPLSFSLIPGLGSLEPEGGTTNATGYLTTTYTASTEAGVDTLIVEWEEATSRQDLADTVIITINPGPPTSLNVNPLDTVVVVTNDAVVVAELLDDYLNHVDATSTDQVTFTSDGLGTFGAKSIDEAGCIAVAYTTDDSMATDTITTQLVGHTTDYTRVRTVGAAPASMHIYADDSMVVVSNNSIMEYFWFYIYDQYGNPSAWADWYGHENYRIAFTVSSGGGVFHWDTVSVVDDGSYENGYYSSTVAGVYTVTGTSLAGTATDDIDITQTPGSPDSLVLTPDSVAIAAGTGITLTAELFDVYGNHINITSAGWVNATTDYGLYDEGSISSFSLNAEDGTVEIVYRSDPYQADTAHVYVRLNLVIDLRSQYQDTVVVFSAEPGDFDHFVIHTIVDTLYVPEFNLGSVEAQDANNIHLYTYEGPDTITLTLDESAADPSQVTWLIGVDTTIGLTALIPENSFENGYCDFLVSNKKAETVTVTATDTAGHTGTSSGLTWLPIDVVGFTVAIEGGLTTITAIDDTVNMEVTAIDEFGNTTGVGLPLNVILSATRPVNFLSGETQLMESQVSLFPMVATQQASDLVLRAADISTPAINGSSDPIIVNPSGIEEGPVVSGISASFGSGDISYAVAADGEVSIKVYNKVGMEVGSLVDGAVSRGYYQASLKSLNLSSDIYFVVMQGPGINKKIKATLIK
jgi:hypothetical protein